MAVARFDLEHVPVDGTMVAPLSRTDFLAAIDTGRLRCDAASRQAAWPSYGMRVTLQGQDFYMSDYQRDVFASRRLLVQQRIAARDGGQPGHRMVDPAGEKPL
ncbi:hypothetical protein [Massilia sp. CCM 8734]|uniref:hypothetical protein n=1 Tax=Massilia sp. CCM 8734 TaxID=2609283 RepID=UPI00141DEF7C|nr:hypothetical protein [Massilia sp. CCM 8734]NHZ99205.1 hypothetical protein [Massilia sp. CCM 8734]